MSGQVVAQAVREARRAAAEIKADLTHDGRTEPARCAWEFWCQADDSAILESLHALEERVVKAAFVGAYEALP